MTTRNLTTLTKKYISNEIKTAIHVLLDILAMQKGRRVAAIDPKDEFTPTQIKRLQRHLSEHNKGSADSMSLNQVKNVLGV